MSQPGIKNGNWQGGISNDPYPFYFTSKLKDKIKKRDGYICKKCNQKKELCIHHIDYDKTNCNENNLISLCRSCHSKTNFNREYWAEYFLLSLSK